MDNGKQSITTIQVGTDGTVEAVLVYEFRPAPHSDETIQVPGIRVDDYEDLEALKKDPDLFIYKDGRVRRRTDKEMRDRVRNIWERVKTGELKRCKDDLIDRFPQYFTSEELEEVERPEDTIKRLKEEVKKLKEKK